MNLVESLNWNGGMTNPRGLKVHIGRTHLFLESPCCSRVGDREEFQFDQLLQWPHPMHGLISGESLNKVMFAVWSVLIFFMWIFSHIVQTRGKIWGPEGKGDIMGLKLEMIVLLYSHCKHAVCCHSAILSRVKDPLTPEFSPLCSCVTKTQPTNPSHPGSKLYCKAQICRPTLRICEPGIASGSLERCWSLLWENMWHPVVHGRSVGIILAQKGPRTRIPLLFATMDRRVAS